MIRRKGRIQSFLSGRIAQWYLNAYNDAYICDELVKYLKDNSYQVKSERAQHFINKFEGETELLAGIAYCEYYWNGLYDYMLAKFQEKILRIENRKNDEFNSFMDVLDEFIKEIGQKNAFNEFGTQIILFRPLTQMLGGRLHYLDVFSDKAGVEISKKIAKKAILIVQRENIKNNKYQSKLIKHQEFDSTVKLKYIEKLSAVAKNRKVFLHSCRNTLRSACIWDQLFRGLVHTRFLLKR